MGKLRGLLAALVLSASSLLSQVEYYGEGDFAMTVEGVFRIGMPLRFENDGFLATIGYSGALVFGYGGATSGARICERWPNEPLILYIAPAVIVPTSSDKVTIYVPNVLELTRTPNLGLSVQWFYWFSWRGGIECFDVFYSQAAVFRVSL